MNMVVFKKACSAVSRRTSLSYCNSRFSSHTFTIFSGIAEKRFLLIMVADSEGHDRASSMQRSGVSDPVDRPKSTVTVVSHSKSRGATSSKPKSKSKGAKRKSSPEVTEDRQAAMKRQVAVKKHKGKRFKDLRWSGSAAKMFHSLSGDNKEVWKAAYEAYHACQTNGVQKLSYHIDFLARPDLFSRGRLLPGMSPDGAWPPFLLHLYQSFYDCAHFTYSARYYLRDHVTCHLSEVVGMLERMLDDDLPENAASELRTCLQLVSDARHNSLIMVSDFFSRKEHMESDIMDE
jgi:hypothetical protein